MWSVIVIPITALLGFVLNASQAAETRPLLEREQIAASIQRFCSSFRPDLLPSKTLDITSVDLSQEGHFIVKLAGDNSLLPEFHVTTNEFEIIFFSILKGLTARAKAGPQVPTQNELENVADSFLSLVEVKPESVKRIHCRKVKTAAQNKWELGEAVWQRHENGLEHRHDYVRFFIDLYEGQVLGYRKVWGSTPESYECQLNKEQGLSIAKQRLKAIHPGIELTASVEPKPVVVYPNTLFGGRKRTASERRVAWLVLFPKQSPALPKPVEVWIDARTGDVLGGDVRNW